MISWTGEYQSVDYFLSRYQSARMNFLRIKFQTVINGVQAIKRHFRRPRQILEADAEVPESFQLLDLPHVVIRNIFLHMDPLALVDLSMTSDEFNEKMKEIKLPADEFFWWLFKDRMILCCCFGGDSKIELRCGPKNPPRPVVKRRIGGKFRLVNLDKGYTSEDPEEPLDRKLCYKFNISRRRRSEEEAAITTHLLDIIKPKMYSLRLHSGIKMRDLFVWKFIMNFDTIALEEKYTTDLFGPKEAQFLFQEVVVRNIEFAFKSVSEGSREKRRAKLLDTTRTIKLRNTIQRISVYGSDIFSAENIINSEVKYLSIFPWNDEPNELVFYKELNKIMKAWQEGEKLTQLVKIDTQCRGISDEELESLLEDIDWTSERPNHPQFEDFAETHGLVRDSLIRRRTDGQLASLSKYYEIFIFVVWREGNRILGLMYD